MKMHVVVMQSNGDVSDREDIDAAAIRKRETARSVLDRCHEIRGEHLPETYAGPFKFEASIGTQPMVSFRWQQIDPFSASALLLADEEPAAFLWVLTGCQPDCDRMAVEMMVDCQTAFTAKTPMNPGPALRKVKERPVAICIPLPTEANRRHAKAVGNVAAAMSIAFVETAFDFLRRLGEAAKRHPAFQAKRPRGFSSN